MYYLNLRRADELPYIPEKWYNRIRHPFKTEETINPIKGRYDRFIKVGSLIALTAFGVIFLHKVSEFRNEVEQEFAKRDRQLAEIVINMSRSNEKLEKILDMASKEHIENPPHTMEFEITYPEN